MAPDIVTITVILLSFLGESQPTEGRGLVGVTEGRAEAELEPGSQGGPLGILVEAGSWMSGKDRGLQPQFKTSPQTRGPLTGSIRQPGPRHPFGGLSCLGGSQGQVPPPPPRPRLLSLAPHLS